MYCHVPRSDNTQYTRSWQYTVFDTTHCSRRYTLLGNTHCCAGNTHGLTIHIVHMTIHCLALCLALTIHITLYYRASVLCIVTSKESEAHDNTHYTLLLSECTVYCHVQRERGTIHYRTHCIEQCVLSYTERVPRSPWTWQYYSVLSIHIVLYNNVYAQSVVPRSLLCICIEQCVCHVNNVCRQTIRIACTTTCVA